MSRRSLRALSIALLLALATASSPALAAGPSDTGSLIGRIVFGTFDLIILRPVTAATTVMGSTLYAVSLPATWPLGGEQTAREALVYAPFYDTFQRPLGTRGGG